MIGRIRLVRYPEGWWVEEVLVACCYRGRGFGRQLRRLLPVHCSLMACPMLGCTGLDQRQLIRFYEGAGFRLVRDDWGQPIMIR